MAETTQGSQPKTSSGLAVASLVLGILAILGSFLPIINNLSFFLALIGGILGTIALIGAIRGKHTAKGLSIAGVVLAVVSIVVVLVTQSAYSAAVNSATEELKTGSKPVSTSAESASQDASEPAKAPEEKEEESNKEADYSNMKLGEAVKLEDGLSITVNSVQPGEDTYDGTPTVVASVTYKNEGDSNESFNILDWKCVNESGVEKGCTYSMSDSEQLDSGKLNAGGTITGNVHFEGSPTKILYYSNILQSDSQIAWVVE